MYETVKVMHRKLLKAFKKVKRDVYDLRASISMQNEAINRLNDNQKALLARITALEAKSRQKPKTITKTKVVKKIVKVAKRKNYVGAKSSMKLHSENCPFAKNINKSNKVIFKTKVKAFNMGYKACECLK